MANMTLSAFKDIDTARKALKSWSNDGFEPGGFTVLAPQHMRGADAAAMETKEDDLLGPLLAGMTEAPALTVPGLEVAGTGALVSWLEPHGHAGAGGLRGALGQAGTDADTIESMAAVLADHGLLLGAATASEERARDAARIAQQVGASQVVVLPVPRSA